MLAPAPLLAQLAEVPGMERGRRRLVVLLSQLGDFDSLEYAQALAGALPQLQAAGIAPLAIGIGAEAGAERFCAFTGFPRELLQVESTPRLHQALGLHPGLQIPGGPWPALLLMCAGVGSPGTLAEVWRGYSGDRSAPQRLASPLFSLAGGDGFQRPFELATVRLRNMIEVLGHWRTYVPRDDFLTQRGGTYLLEADDSLLYTHVDRGLLGFSATMARPLAFLDPWLPDPEGESSAASEPG
ncbi:MAG: peroxiredoxin-like family protein [Cyanobacteriota bacterium]